MSKRKIDRGQRRLSFTSTLTTDHPVEEAEGSTPPPQKRRGVTDSWKSFAKISWRKKHFWLLVKSDRVYCLYCSHSHTCARNKTGIFATVPFIGVRPDKLVKHEKSATHQLCADDYREFESRQASSSSDVEIMHRSYKVTVDERAFCDSLKCMYWLAKHEVPHVSLFSPLLDL